MPKIQIKNVNKTYEDPDGNPVDAIDIINLDIEDGEFVSIVGPSGCGKTTLVEIVADISRGAITQDSDYII